MSKQTLFRPRAQYFVMEPTLTSVVKHGQFAESMLRKESVKRIPLMAERVAAWALTQEDPVEALSQFVRNTTEASGMQYVASELIPMARQEMTSHAG